MITDLAWKHAAGFRTAVLPTLLHKDYEAGCAVSGSDGSHSFTFCSLLSTAQIHQAYSIKDIASKKRKKRQQDQYFFIDEFSFRYRRYLRPLKQFLNDD